MGFNSPSSLKMDFVPQNLAVHHMQILSPPVDHKLLILCLLFHYMSQFCWQSWNVLFTGILGSKRRCWRCWSLSWWMKETRPEGKWIKFSQITSVDFNFLQGVPKPSKWEMLSCNVSHIFCRPYSSIYKLKCFCWHPLTFLEIVLLLLCTCLHRLLQSTPSSWCSQFST